MLAVSSVLLALGLALLALSHGLPVYLASWIVIGLGEWDRGCTTPPLRH